MKALKKSILAFMLTAVMFVVSGCGGSSDKDFTIGTTTDTYYENEFFGIRYTPSSDMTLQDEEYIKLVNQAIASVLDDSSVKTALDEGNFATIVYATSADGTKTFNIGVQNIKSVFNSLVSDEYIIDNSLSDTETLLKSMGTFDSVKVTKGKGQLLGKEVLSMDVTATVSGINFYEKEVLLRQGNYMMFITAAAFYDESVTQDILNCITELK